MSFSDGQYAINMSVLKGQKLRGQKLRDVRFNNGEVEINERTKAAIHTRILRRAALARVIEV
jgi:hypothetical protein